MTASAGATSSEPAHPRDQLLHTAGVDLLHLLVDWQAKYDLTGIEKLVILNRVEFTLLSRMANAERASLAEKGM